MINRIKRWWFRFTDPHYTKYDPQLKRPYGQYMWWVNDTAMKNFQWYISLGDGYYYVKTIPYETIHSKPKRP